GPPLLLLHGFMGSAESWAPRAAVFAARGMRTIAVDLIGHGRSDAPADPARYGMERCVEDLVEVLDRLHLPRAAVLGYSMGGRVALHLASAAPERVSALVLESASPGLADALERERRIASDEALADALLQDGLDAFVDRWERQPLFASQRSLPPAERDRLRAQRLRQRPLGLANSLRGYGTGRQPSLWDGLVAVATPTLLLVGALDEKFRTIGQSMVAALPRARLVLVPGAGHTVHLEQPRLFDDLVLGFLGAVEDGADAQRMVEVSQA
ncbi:MAG: 2-succinyl-6-hydroxy-2,4-cyclohexadiene-1-carboxylate synthase, partial [Chloroflexi bacterium]|nr:2-succinyl-6-hydroxy-2,4-cyclohexadiene-1-carboxylate synthase [Chloroflexota bacterium]